MSEWYYAHGGEQKGPVPVSELQRLADSGEFDPAADLVWREGMEDWKPAGTIEEIGAAFQPAAEAAPMSGPAPSSAAPAADAVNPYAAPAVVDPPGGTDAAVVELPAVKSANFGLCATLIVIGTLGIIGSYAYFFYVLISNQGDPAAAERAIEGVMAPFAIGLVGSLIPLMIGSIMSLVYLYRAWVLLQPHTAYSTPGKAVGFLFIPFFNLYWIFIAYWRWSQEWNRLVASNPRHANAPRMSDGLFLTYPILSIAAGVLGIIGIIPLVIVQLLVIKGICSAVNYAARR